MRSIRPDRIVMTSLPGPLLHASSNSMSSFLSDDQLRVVPRSKSLLVLIPFPQPQRSGRAANVILTFPSRTDPTRWLIDCAPAPGARLAIKISEPAATALVICMRVCS
jgi:hypothetical protein